MFQKVYLFFFVLLGFNATAQIRVSGVVADQNGEGLIGANVYLKDTYDGATTDSKGKFQFETYEKGQRRIVVTFVGYESIEETIDLSVNVELVFKLKESFNDLEAVTITAGSFETSDKKRVVVLKSLDIATTAGATADITGALTTLPGTQKVGESGRLFVRGGTAEETKIFVDGVEAANYYSATSTGVPSRSRFSPFLFKGTFFSTGGYSAEFGKALSSTLILNTKDVGAENKIDVSLMSVGFETDVARTWKDQTIHANIGYTNLTPYYQLIPQRIDWTGDSQGFTGLVSYAKKLQSGATIKGLVMGNSSNFGFDRSTITTQSGRETVRLQNQNIYGNVSINLPVGETDQLYIGYSRTQDYNQIRYNELSVENPTVNQHFKAKFVHEFSSKTHLNSGAEIFTEQFDEEVNTFDKSSFEKFNPSVYSELSHYLNEQIAVRLGMRGEYENAIESTTFSPRVSMAYKLNDFSQLSLATGQFYQTPGAEYLKITSDFNSEKSNHYILNFQKIKNDRIFRTEAYCKDYNHLVRYQDQYDPSTFSNAGEGFAYGLDIFWRDRKTLKYVDYWVSYSWMQSERLYKDYPEHATPTFATGHNLSIVAKRFFTRWKTQMGATYSFSSGRPYENPNLEGFIESKAKAYHDLSFNLAYLPNPKVIIYASATNILGVEQIFGYRYAPEQNEAGVFESEAIQLPAKRFLFIGCFITIGTFNNQLENL